jgi:hypothetical protein
LPEPPPRSPCAYENETAIFDFAATVWLETFLSSSQYQNVPPVLRRRPRAERTETANVGPGSLRAFAGATAAGWLETVAARATGRLEEAAHAVVPAIR